MATINVPLSLAGTIIRPAQTIQFGVCSIPVSASVYVKALGLHWIKSVQPRSPMKINHGKKVLSVGLWCGDSDNLLGPSASPILGVGLDCQGFEGSIPYQSYDLSGNSNIRAAVTNNSTHLQILVTVTGYAEIHVSDPSTVTQATFTTSSTSPTVITNTPTQVVV